MWIAPPSGLRRISAATTASVRCAVSSRTRADAALWPPLTARNALVTAIAIFDGSNATTAPLRRMTLYWASRGSVLIAGCELASVAVGLCVGARDGARAELATCMVRSPGKILSLLVRTHATAQEKPVRSGSNPDAGFRNIRRCSPFGASGAPQRFFYVSGFPLRIKIYYILCSSAESTLIIVAWVGGRKPFLMHTKGAAKGSKNQRSIGGCAIAAPSIHRKLTMLSTAGKVYAKREGRRSWLTHF